MALPPTPDTFKLVHYEGRTDCRKAGGLHSAEILVLGIFLHEHAVDMFFWSWVPLLITVRKRSCGKVMFSQVCVKNSVHGGWRGVQPPRQTSPSKTPPPKQTPPSYGHCSGRYASYFNAFLFKLILLQTLAEILYEAASDCRYVDPKKVEQILGVSQPEADPPIRRSTQPVTTDEGAYNQGS